MDDRELRRHAIDSFRVIQEQDFERAGCYVSSLQDCAATGHVTARAAHSIGASRTTS